MFSPMLEAQLPLFKITVAKLFALMTLLIILFYHLVTSGIFYTILGGIVTKTSSSATYFVVVHFTVIYGAIFSGLLLTATYFFLPQLQQKIGMTVFLLLSIGTCLMFVTDVISASFMPAMFNNSGLLSSYSVLSILSLTLLTSGFGLFLGQLIYELLIKRKSHNL